MKYYKNIFTNQKKIDFRIIMLFFYSLHGWSYLTSHRNIDK